MRHTPLDLEDASDVSIYILVFPGHSVGSDDIGKPVMGHDILLLLPHFFSVSASTERCFRIWLLLVIVYACQCFFVPPAYLGLKVFL